MEASKPTRSFEASRLPSELPSVPHKKCMLSCMCKYDCYVYIMCICLNMHVCICIYTCILVYIHMYGSRRCSRGRPVGFPPRRAAGDPCGLRQGGRTMIIIIMIIIIIIIVICNTNNNTNNNDNDYNNKG